ncbi:hypothetical protein CY34DRAFT_27105 [Suillus luteus UH-Slu-Lm8-n1]|uniref:Uncharacterized protein n=1 Tax=Suillus luteus UH-Slu-Lm8-n1 TaxID=930992 RepID=A0A0D0AM77_9AGAM|nr:hypothetical protein CY34DRAFT_27105 [Suillus luteus UH-Slu-Lm8-n1]
MLDTGFLEPEDLGSEKPGDPLPYLGCNIRSPETLLAAVDHFDRYNTATAASLRPLTPHDAHNLPPDQEEQELQYQLQQAIKHAEENLDIDQDLDPDANPLEDVDEYEDLLGEAQPAKDNPDPFFIADGLCAEDTADITHLPGHLVSIYAVMSWLHLQFHLPKVTCNTLLAIFTCILLTLSPNIELPFVTLQSSNCVLGVDKPFYTLPICPLCHNVFPPKCSPHSHDQCTLCNKDLFLPDKTAHGNQRSVKSPRIKYPYLPLSDQIKSLLKVPGLKSLLDGWHFKARTPNQHTNIFDGSMDGNLFFSNLPHEKAGPGGELHIGVNLGVDCNIAPSHSSCPTSFSICNLPPEYRYRTSNLMCTSILPGPKEQNPDQIQCFLHPIVSDLLLLWKDGIKVPTKSCPQVVCDKPAAHKIGGFASHSHTHFCTACWINIANKDKPSAFTQGAFKVRMDREHRELGEQYCNLTTTNARKNFIKDFATRYTQLSRLPYFNIVEQIIIDPMHNLFLGLVKTHFYGIWFIVPVSCSRLPTDIGMPSGGSLTADQWLLLATAYGPIILWSTCLPYDGDDQILHQRVAMIQKLENEKEADATCKLEDRTALAKKRGKEAFEAKKAHIARDKLAASEAKNQEKLRLEAIKQTKKAQLAAEKKAKATQRKQNVEGLPEAQFLNREPDDGNSEPTNNKFSLHPDDPANFLKLSAAFRILIKHQICDHELDHADRLLREYCSELINLYGSAVIKPNHHYATHVVECTCNFGPLHDFWTFLFERLNKVLKAFKTNNHENGELETTFFTEFQRTSSNEEQGTVAGLTALSKDLDDVNANAGQSYALSPRHQKTLMTTDTYRLLAQTLCFRYPVAPVHCLCDCPIVPHSLPLDRAVFFDK